MTKLFAHLFSHLFNDRQVGVLLSFIFIFSFLFSQGEIAQASFTNHNSVMLGDRAGGMGGAYTALSHDPAAGAFYNPATLARLEGSSMSTSVNLFNKYDAKYGTNEQLDRSIFRINKGSIVSIPSASGIFNSFRSFTTGLSIVIPDYQVFGGDIYRKGEDSTFLRLDDKSLWVGGAFAFNISEESAVGLTIYYTSQSYSRSLMNRYDTGAEIIVENEEKTFSQNSIVYVAGYYRQITPEWSMGLSYRLPSVPVDGSGSYLRSQIGTVSGAQPVVSNNRLGVQSRIPTRLAGGVAYSRDRDMTVSFDVSFYGADAFNDLSENGDRIQYDHVVNYALGFEKYLEPWVALRLGVFTDYASTPSIPAAPSHRYQDHIDKFGFSANVGLHTTEHTTVSLGGYYLGGNGVAGELIGDGYQRIKKTERLFSFLVGSSYSF